MILRTGTRGDEVIKLQRRLGIKDDGIFGKDTRKAVIAFQKSVGLHPDGIVGKNTQAALSVDGKTEDRINAFLATISYAEGTDRYGNQKGYDVIVGGSLMDSYADHPRKLVRLNSYGISSTAAGRYQILARYYDAYKKSLNLPDFSPRSQDAIAIQMIKEQRAWEDVKAGRIEEAIKKVSNIWASFPNAGYGQREVAMYKLVDFYNSQLGLA